MAQSGIFGSAQLAQLRDGSGAILAGFIGNPLTSTKSISNFLRQPTPRHQVKYQDRADVGEPHPPIANDVINANAVMEWRFIKGGAIAHAAITTMAKRQCAVLGFRHLSVCS